MTRNLQTPTEDNPIVIVTLSHSGFPRVHVYHETAELAYDAALDVDATLDDMAGEIGHDASICLRAMQSDILDLLRLHQSQARQSDRIRYQRMIDAVMESPIARPLDAEGVTP